LGNNSRCSHLRGYPQHVRSRCLRVQRIVLAFLVRRKQTLVLERSFDRCLRLCIAHTTRNVIRALRGQHAVPTARRLCLNIPTMANHPLRCRPWCRSVARQFPRQRHQTPKPIHVWDCRNQGESGASTNTFTESNPTLSQITLSAFMMA